MSLLDELSKFISELKLENLSKETLDHLKLHIFDSLGALLAGSLTEEAQAHSEVIKTFIPETDDKAIPVVGTKFYAPLPYAALLSSISARLTETDDIDIASCVTPGAVIVPSALSVGYFVGARGKEFMEAILSGYELMTRLGSSFNGAEIIYQGIWPTYLFGAVGVASVVSKILGLNPDQIKNALAIALSLSSGLSGRIKGEYTSRWLTLGCAIHNGILSSFSASRGFLGDPNILDRSFQSIYGLSFKKDILLEGLGKSFQIEKINIKPYCTARQALSSIEAFRYLIKKYHINPEKIDEIEVNVPRQYSLMIDRKDFPEDRSGSIVSIQYQLAISAFYEDDLFDIERKFLRDEYKIRNFMGKIKVIASEHLTKIYPNKWSGKILLKTSDKKYEHEVLSPKGDSDQPMGWDDVENKITRIIKGKKEYKKIEELKNAIKNLNESSDIKKFFSLLMP
jgi:2-methylcitrate dehydratase PrpD